MMSETSTPTFVSTIICTYNGAQTIERVLRSIEKQNGIGDIFSLELIVVNNNSNDETLSIVRRHIDSFSRLSKISQIIIVDEKNQGLVHARRRGVIEANGEIILFCDDDNVLDGNYIVTALNILADKDIGAVGGRGVLHTANQSCIPSWFNSFQSFYAVGSQLSESAIANERGYIWGAGMVLRSKLLKPLYEAGIQHILTGRSSHQVLSGDDSEISAWVLLQNMSLWYSDDLVFTHIIQPERLTEDYLKKLKHGFANSWPYLRLYHLAIRRRLFIFIFAIKITHFISEKIGFRVFSDSIEKKIQSAYAANNIAFETVRLNLELIKNINKYSDNR